MNSSILTLRKKQITLSGLPNVHHHGCSLSTLTSSPTRWSNIPNDKTGRAARGQQHPCIWWTYGCKKVSINKDSDSKDSNFAITWHTATNGFATTLAPITGIIAPLSQGLVQVWACRMDNNKMMVLEWAVSPCSCSLWRCFQFWGWCNHPKWASFSITHALIWTCL